VNFEAEMDCVVTRLTLFWRSFETFFGLFIFQINKSTYYYVRFLDVILFLLVANIKTFMLAIWF